MPTTMHSIVMLTRLPLRFGSHRTLHPSESVSQFQGGLAPSLMN